MSEKIKFCYYNLVNQSATTITGSTEDAFYPASNLKHDFSTKVWRSTTSSASIVFDFITTEPVNTVVLQGHLIDGISFSGSLTIEANATNVWTSPAFTDTMTVNSEFNLGIKTLTTTQNYRYWRISGTGSLGYLELANIFIGSHYQPQRNIGNQFTFDNKDLSKFKTNEYGQRFIDSIASQRSIKGKVNLLTKTGGVDDWFDFINFVGKNKPFYVIFDESEVIINEKERFSGYYYFRNKPKTAHVIKGIYNSSLDMIEAT